MASVLALLLVAAKLTVSILNQDRTAQATAQAYFDALAAGDASTANALTAAQPFEPDGPDLLTDEVLGGATERISNISVTEANDPLDVFNQNVNVTYTLAGQSFTDHLTMAQGKPEWGFLKTWQMSRPFALNDIFWVEGTSSFTISGVQVDATTPSTYLFPAVYPIAPADPNYFDLAEDHLVAAGERQRRTVTFIPKPELQAEVQRQVNERVDECAANLTTAGEPLSSQEGCPRLYVKVPQQTSESGSWEVVEYPTVQLSHGGSFSTTSDGAARFHPDSGVKSIEMLGGVETSTLVTVTDGKVAIFSQQ